MSILAFLALAGLLLWTFVTPDQSQAHLESIREHLTDR